MLAALIPVSDTLRRPGAADVIASTLADVGAALPGYGALSLILIAAMTVMPFHNNAATVCWSWLRSPLGLRPACITGLKRF